MNAYELTRQLFTIDGEMNKVMNFKEKEIDKEMIEVYDRKLNVYLGNDLEIINTLKLNNAYNLSKELIQVMGDIDSLLDKNNGSKYEKQINVLEEKMFYIKNRLKNINIK